APPRRSRAVRALRRTRAGPLPLALESHRRLAACQARDWRARSIDWRRRSSRVGLPKRHNAQRRRGDPPRPLTAAYGPPHAETRSMTDLDPLFWLITGGALLSLAAGRAIIPLAAWLAPAFLLHAAHAAPGWRMLVGVWLIIAVAIGVANRGIVPIPGVRYAS